MSSLGEYEWQGTQDTSDPGPWTWTPRTWGTPPPPAPLPPSAGERLMWEEGEGAMNEGRKEGKRLVCKEGELAMNEGT